MAEKIIPRITKAEYPNFQRMFPSDLPASFSDYEMRELTVDEMHRANGDEPRYVGISLAGFTLWSERLRSPITKYRDLFGYAADLAEKTKS